MKTLRSILLTLLASGGLCLPAGAEDANGPGNSTPGDIASKPPRPNILFILTDDQRFDTIGALGYPAIKTPHLDSLARSGMAFDNAYCFGANSQAVCMPSRNMLLSGRTYFRWQGIYAPADGPSLPVAFRQAGYETYHHGKSGNTAKLIEKTFEISKYLPSHEDRVSGEPGRMVVDEAIEFLRTRKGDRPFLMYLAPGSPHDPLIAAPHYLELYQRDGVPLPKNFMAQHPFDNGDMVVRDELLESWPRTEEQMRRRWHEYYAVMSGLDHHLGRLLAYLRASHLDANTIIILASDNGLALGSHGLLGKQNVYEPSAKVPLILSGPGIRQGRSGAMVYLMDLPPTLCELANVPAPPGMDGRSFASVLCGEAGHARRTIFYAYLDVQRAIRDERWKLIRYPQINKTQFFDLQNDPDELHDLAADPAVFAPRENLLLQLADAQGQFGDALPLCVEKPGDPAFHPPTGEALEKLLNAAHVSGSQRGAAR